MEFGDTGFSVLAACLTYLTLMVLIGALSARFSSGGILEFFLGGRRLSGFVVALSAVVSGRSAWLLLGFTGVAFTRGISAVWAVVGYIVAELFMFLFMAPALRSRTEELDAMTIPDFLEGRFGNRGQMLRILSVAVILVFMTAYVGGQFKAGGKAFDAAFGIDAGSGVLVTAAIVLVYTMLGGFLAVSITDLVQACLMIIALVAVPILAVADCGGVGPMLEKLGGLDSCLLDPLALGAGGLIAFLGIGLGSPGNPHILVRYMSVSDPRQLRLSAVVGTIWNTVMAWGALFIGLAGRALLETKEALPDGDVETVYLCLASRYLSPFLYGLVLSSVLAAIMSTADSQLLVAASAVVRDIGQKILGRSPPGGQGRDVLLSRAVVALLVVVAVVLGILAEDLVFWLVLFAWGGVGAAFGPTIILALCWKGMTRWGAAAGLITGASVLIVWKLSGLSESVVYELVPAFFLSALAIWAVSLFTRSGGRPDGRSDGRPGGLVD